MKKLLVLAGILGTMMLVSNPVCAAAITYTGSIDANTDVDFYNFSLNGETFVTFNILAYEPPTYDFFSDGAGNNLLDSQILLYLSDGTFVDQNDDSTDSGHFAEGALDGSVSALDSYIQESLLAGDYALAVASISGPATTNYPSDIWTGTNPNGASHGLYKLTITFEPTSPTPTSVPEPSTLLLLGVGLSFAGWISKLKERRLVKN
jgi:PEP-CTERM motif